jgi:hypothetical protein
MPKLLLFAPCEKVIIDETTKTTSLIVLLETVHIAIPRADQDKVPRDANIPINWQVLTLWQTEPQDQGKQLEMRFATYLPTGEEIGIAGSMLLRFEPGKPNFRGVISIAGVPLFPLLQVDRFVLKLFFREQGAMNEWQFVADYPIMLSRP